MAENFQIVGFENPDSGHWTWWHSSASRYCHALQKLPHQMKNIFFVFFEASKKVTWLSFWNIKISKDTFISHCWNLWNFVLKVYSEYLLPSVLLPPYSCNNDFGSVLTKMRQHFFIYSFIFRCRNNTKSRFKMHITL